MKGKLLSVVVLALLSQSCGAYAVDTQWHWEAFGTDSYSGQVQLQDDQGGTSTYQRYADGVTPQMFGAASVQSPLAVVAGRNIEFDMVQAGTNIAKPSCTSPEVPKIFVTPTTVCYYNSADSAAYGSNIGGIHAYAEDTDPSSSSGYFIPRVQLWIQGLGWQQIDNHPCATVEVKTLCAE